MRRKVIGSRFPLRPALAVLAVALLLLVGCSTDDPQNTFSPAGDVAKDQRDLLVLVLWPAGVVLVVVNGLLIYALIRFRRKRDDEMPRQVHGNTRLEIAWTIAPAILLLVLAVPMLDLLIDLGRAPAADALHVRVTGFQWNWQFEYLDPEYEDLDPIIGLCPEDCAQLHVPVGREIGIELEAVDVVHSFWVPRLAGKLDAIPGRTNLMWFKVEEPGSFSGQCAEFCGLGHADMRMVIMAESPEDFDDWVEQQRAQQAREAGPAEPRVALGGE